jgi:hypothetical protein
MHQESHLGYFSIIFFCDVSNCEFYRILRRRSELFLVKNLGFGLFYFQRFILWKLRIFTIPKINLKQVILVNLL